MAPRPISASQCLRADYERARVTFDKAKGAIGYERLDGATDVAKVSVIGIGMRSHAGVAAQAFKALSQQKINILAITTSEIKFSVLIKAAQSFDTAVRTCIRCTDWIRRKAASIVRA